MKGIAGLLVIAGAYDVWAVRTRNETISCGWHRMVRHERGRLLVGAGLGILVAHLSEPWTTTTS